MTSTPSASLHVLPPTPADIKPFPDHPPSPLTPRTLNSATSSRAHISEDSTYPTVAPASPTTEHPPRTAMAARPGELAAPEASKYVFEGDMMQGRTNGDETAETSNMQMLGLKCAPPDVLPPSPPLTVADPREDSELEEEHPAASSSSAQRQDITFAPPRMREEDITDWRASMHKDGEDEEEGRLDGAGDGEYDPYDLGYSPEVSPATPVGPSVHAMHASSTQDRLKAQGGLLEAPDHPLQLDVHPPSPPLWELIPPPETNGLSRTQTRVNPSSNAPNPLTLRPLIPHSAYYFGPPPVDAAFGTDPVGQIGVHHPREIIRIERDYSGGELVQFAATYPLELEGRITPTQFLDTINAINERLINAHSLRHSLVDNALSFLTLQLSRLVLTPHYEKEMHRLHQLIDDYNTNLWNPVGLNILWPRNVAFMFLEVEYY